MGTAEKKKHVALLSVSEREILGQVGATFAGAMAHDRLMRADIDAWRDGALCIAALNGNTGARDASGATGARDVSVTLCGPADCVDSWLAARPDAARLRLAHPWHHPMYRDVPAICDGRALAALPELRPGPPSATAAIFPSAASVQGVERLNAAAHWRAWLTIPAFGVAIRARGAGGTQATCCSCNDDWADRASRRLSWYERHHHAWLRRSSAGAWEGWSAADAATSELLPRPIPAWQPWSAVRDATEAPYVRWFVDAQTNSAFNELDFAVLKVSQHGWLSCAAAAPAATHSALAQMPALNGTGAGTTGTGAGTGTGTGTGHRARDNARFSAATRPRGGGASTSQLDSQVRVGCHGPSAHTHKLRSLSRFSRALESVVGPRLCTIHTQPRQRQ